MEASKTDAKKRKGWSIWAPHGVDIKKYQSIGVSVASIYKILTAKNERLSDATLPSLYRWLARQR